MSQHLEPPEPRAEAIAGNWSILGILDAFPDEVIPALENDADRFLSNAVAALSLEGLWQAIATLALITRTRIALGRPATSFGMTPLLIFREVAY